ncbi:hypothetical protein EGR_10331 [Echinococcus granulosus]|uniref:Uncharacterized protein n=1 Tax=Echinococcus granulosus TaxID=6210 RepID=W6U8K8_ECHGR|nr:hypothetical protein EGR_10331 [Echinococcus granulosus]EUB54802.1 hypothetical protein EGR_10331 [Echinococcus granulosus]
MDWEGQEQEASGPKQTRWSQLNPYFDLSSPNGTHQTLKETISLEDNQSSFQLQQLSKIICRATSTSTTFLTFLFNNKCKLKKTMFFLFYVYKLKTPMHCIADGNMQFKIQLFSCITTIFTMIQVV